MRLSYRILGTGGYVTLCDDASGGKFLESFTPAFSCAVQDEALFRSGRRFRRTRGGGSCALPLRVSVQYESASAALDAVRVVASLMEPDVQVHLKIEEGTGRPQYYGHATLNTYRPTVTGVSVLHEMDFTTDLPTLNEPADT